MANDVFLLGVALLSTWLLAWGFRTLPREGWQIVAAVPLIKEESDRWHGLNLTYYGVFHASATVAGAAMMLVLLGAVRVPLPAAGIMASLLLMCCIPASSLVARIVERKRATFTVAGAVFVGILLGPWLFLGANRLLGPALGWEVPMAAVLAAASIGYALGEGIGRLACVSFGCCYGKPVSQLPPRWRGYLDRYCFVFAGKTKKVAYEGGLEGKRVVPIQAVTAVVFVAIALLGAGIYLRGHLRVALFLTFGLTQAWRSVSEVFRADYRGCGTVSAYQIMALAGIAYLGLLLPWLPEAPVPAPEIVEGLRTVWDPTVILGLQGLWIAMFLHTGRSVVTGATLSFHVRRDRV
jgi:hypothetical protein